MFQVQKSPLVEAFEKDDAAEVQKLTRPDANADFSAWQGRAPLHVAAEYNAAECLAVLLKAESADPNVTDDDGWTPLHVAASKNNVQCVEVLLADGRTDPNIKEGDSWTALHVAASKNAVVCAIVLLQDRRIDPNAKTDIGSTPLHICSYSDDRLEVAEELLRSRATDITVKNNMDRTPLQLSIKRGVPKLAALIRDRDKILDSDPSTRAQDKQQIQGIEQAKVQYLADGPKNCPDNYLKRCEEKEVTQREGKWLNRPLEAQKNKPPQVQVQLQQIASLKGRIEELVEEKKLTDTLLQHLEKELQQESGNNTTYQEVTLSQCQRIQKMCQEASELNSKLQNAAMVIVKKSDELQQMCHKLEESSKNLQEAKIHQNELKGLLERMRLDLAEHQDDARCRFHGQQIQDYHAQKERQLHKMQVRNLRLYIEELLKNHIEELQKLTGPKYPLSLDTPGCVILIANTIFHDRRTRLGTQQDIDAVTDLFKTTLKYDLQLQENATGEQMRQILKHVAESQDTAKYSSCVVVLLSHGDARGIAGVDGDYISERFILRTLGRSCVLVGKPKLVLIQACRWDKELQHVGPPEPTVAWTLVRGSDKAAPESADILVAQATPAGCGAHRHKERGSVFIQSFVRIGKEHARQYDVEKILKMVRADVADEMADRGIAAIPCDSHNTLRKNFCLT